MKAAVIATIILVVLFGGAAYLAAAGTLIIYALGNNKATKGKELFSGFWARLCFGAQYIQSSRLSKLKTESNFKKERIRQWETV